jgi:hypothetical protein
VIREIDRVARFERRGQSTGNETNWDSSSTSPEDIFAILLRRLKN